MKQQSYLNGVDMQCMRLLAEYHYLTVSQLLTLRTLSKNSLSTEQPRLKKLTEQGYLIRRHVGRADGSPGNSQYVYTLSTKGQHALDDGAPEFSRVRKSVVSELSMPFMLHTLAMNDFCIAARLLPRFVPAITLAGWYHDLTLKRQPIKVRMPLGKPYEVTVIPDAWLDFRMTVPDRAKPVRRRCVLLELDRGSEHVSRYKNKVAALYAYAASDAYRQFYGTNLCLVAFATTAGDDRLFQMKQWCEQVVTELGIEEDANLYRYAAIPEGELDPQEVFCGEMWYKPFEDEPVPLLWKQ